MLIINWGEMSIFPNKHLHLTIQNVNIVLFINVIKGIMKSEKVNSSLKVHVQRETAFDKKKQ